MYSAPTPSALQRQSIISLTAIRCRAISANVNTVTSAYCSTEQEEIYENIAKLYYKNLSDNNKNELVDFLYNLDPKMLRSVFLENVDEDIIIKKYWIPFINMQLNNIIKGDK